MGDTRTIAPSHPPTRVRRFVLGYSLTFGESSWNGFIGDIESYPFFRDVSAFECGGGDTIPHMLLACFQM